MRAIAAHARGLGLREEFVQALCDGPKRLDIDFLELAPDNWMGVGGRKREQLDQIADKYPLIAHGLSLSIADTQSLNVDFIRQIRTFLDDYGIDMYSDHLCLSRDAQGYLYDLLPVPRYASNVAYVSDRIKRVQDLTARRLILENISYYHSYPDQMPEGEFFAAVVEQSGCGVLLDINNAYVNGHNHDHDPMDMVRHIPSDAIAYYHIAGHLRQDDGMLLDTHGMPVIDEVVQLGQDVLALHGERPLLLERDNRVPPLDRLCDELVQVHHALGEACHVTC